MVSSDQAVMMRLIALLLSLALAGTSALAQDVSTRLSDYMEARTGLGQFSGSVLVARHDTVLMSKAFGYASLELAVPNTTASRLRAASITKQFTALAILQLRDAGRLSLSDPISKYVDSSPPQWAPVTIEHLLRHSSGIPDYEEALELGSEAYAAFMVSTSNDKRILSEARAKALDFPPGTKFRYSNTGYMLLSQIIEKVSGRSYADYMESKIFRPAGMSRTNILRADGFAPGAATGYTTSGNIPLDSTVGGIPLLKGLSKPVASIDVSGLHGDANMLTTPEDLNTWLQALRGSALAKRSTVAEMFVPGLGDGKVEEEGYGFGWIMGTRFGKKIRYHTGFVPGFASRIDSYPASGVIVIVMSNLDIARTSRITRDLGAMAHGLPYDVPRSHRIVKLDRTALDPLVGSYRLADGTIGTVTIGDTYLELAIPKRFTAGLLAKSPSLFYAPFFEGTVSFARDSSGKVVSLTMHYDGADQVAIRQ
jgi:CubicO group peptidase (beta-lactamase class C family)